MRRLKTEILECRNSLMELDLTKCILVRFPHGIKNALVNYLILTLTS